MSRTVADRRGSVLELIQLEKRSGITEKVTITIEIITFTIGKIITCKEKTISIFSVRINYQREWFRKNSLNLIFKVKTSNITNKTVTIFTKHSLTEGYYEICSINEEKL